jgi:hypothetical protein
VKQNFMFTSESVTEGHPDKLCDQIADALVDRFLQQDPLARIIAECAVAKSVRCPCASPQTPRGLSRCRAPVIADRLRSDRLRRRDVQRAHSLLEMRATYPGSTSAHRRREIGRHRAENH